MQNIIPPRGRTVRWEWAKRYAGLHCNNAEARIKSLAITIRSHLVMELRPRPDRNLLHGHSLKKHQVSAVLLLILNRSMFLLLKIILHNMRPAAKTRGEVGKLNLSWTRRNRSLKLKICILRLLRQKRKAKQHGSRCSSRI